MYEELILYRRIVPQESSALDVLKFIFQNNLLEFLLMLSSYIKYS